LKIDLNLTSKHAHHLFKTMKPISDEDYKKILAFIDDVEDWLDWVSGTDQGPELVMEVAKTRLGVSEIYDIINKYRQPSTIE